jgi:hypothetical protein
LSLRDSSSFAALRATAAKAKNATPRTWRPTMTHSITLAAFTEPGIVVGAAGPP